MNQNTNAETWDLPVGSNCDRKSGWESQSISAKHEIGGNAHLGKSEETIVAMNLKTLQLQGAKGLYFVECFLTERRAYDCRKD